MKYLKIIVITFIVLFTSTLSKSEIKVAFIQMDVLMSESSAGKSLFKQLNIIDKKNQKNFKQIKDKLNIEKDDISKKKNILSSDEYEKKVNDLNKKFKSFQSDAKNKIENLKSKRNTGINKILKELNPLLSEYSDKNQLAFIIDQKNIIIGKTELNITNEILKLLNQKLPKINLD